MPETINGIPSFVFIWIGAMILFVTTFTFISINKNKKHKSELNEFMEKYPDASKIYEVVKGVAGIYASGVEIHAVDGELPLKFIEKGKSGVWVSPGEHCIQVEASHTRAGIIYKSVTKSTGTIDKLVDIKPYTSYDLHFDRKTSIFSFKERGAL